jgi:peptide/nickel transport system substrate-binding protein
MRVDSEPFDDVRVRQAMKLVIDRQDYLDAVFQGMGELAADHPVPPFDPMHADIPPPERDIDQARELLEEAGYADGLDLELHTTAGRVGLQESALAFQEMAQEAGIRVEVTNHPVDAYWAEIYMERPFFMSNWSGRPVADQTLAVAYFEDAGWNETGWFSEEMEELVISARQTLDEGERRELLAQAQEIMAEEGAVVIPFFISLTGAWNERVQNFQVHPLRWVDLHDVWLEGVT